MSRRYTPADTPLAVVLAGRVDAIETRLTDLSDDVTAIGRGVTDLTTQIRHLASSGGGNPGDGTGDPSDEGDEGDDQDKAQIDWFAVTDPAQATGIVTALTGWADAVLAHYGITVPVPCWPLHPAVVADLIALDAERAAAYSGPKPTPVSEFLARWLPATRDRITTALAPCVVERGHWDTGRAYDTTGFDPLSAATWWATNRQTPAPEAFALTELT